MTITETLAALNAGTSGGYEPPDVVVAAGPGFVVQMVNLASRIWRTTPGAPSQLAQTLDLQTFFGVHSDRLTDPRVVYDTQSGRWFASISDIDSSSVLLAVSTTGDPTAAWSLYTFAASGCADQPRLGIADDTVVLSADVFASCDSGFSPLLGGEIWVVNKAQLVAGTPNAASSTYGPDRAYESLAPVQSLSATSTEYVVAVDNPTSRVVHLLAIDGVPPGAVHVQHVAALSVSPLSPPPRGQEPPNGTGDRPPAIETNDDRILDSVWENGKLWLSANTGCIPSGDTNLRSCARVIEIATATRTVDWDTDLSRPGAHVFYPAIRPDGSGNLVIIYGESSTAILPELLVIARAADGTFSAPVEIAQSASQYSGGRFGDYFGAARDPSQPAVVWVAGEYGNELPGVRAWSTSVASVQVTAAGVAPPVVSSSAPPLLRARSVSGRVGVSLRLSYRALDDGVDVREKVTVSARQKVVFAATTSVGRLNAGQLYYVPWHPAKKLRGTFTWCVVSIATDTRRSPRSCSTVILR